MNRIAGILSIFFLIATSASAGMVRFVRAVDGQTIVIDRNGTQVVVALTGVSVQPEDQANARTYLEHELTGRWLLVENGNVWRSPDSLFVNRAMQERGHVSANGTRERYLGEADFEPKKTSTPAPRPESKSYRRTSRRSPATPRRGR